EANSPETRQKLSDLPGRDAGGTRSSGASSVAVLGRWWRGSPSPSTEPTAGQRARTLAHTYGPNRAQNRENPNVHRGFRSRPRGFEPLTFGSVVRGVRD